MGGAIVAVACAPLQQPPPPERPAAAQSPQTAPPGARATTLPVEPIGPIAPGLQPPAAPQKIALLLPLSGAQRAAAEAVRDGFIAAYLAAGQASLPRPAIMILDEEQRGAAAAYQEALQAGASVVVGPLLKESVAQVSGVAGTATTLTLNFLDGGAAVPRQFYQFALSPEDEAREVAARASADGRRRALALAPANEWGRRMIAAFDPALQEQGGVLLDYRLYDPGGTDFTADISRLLQLDEGKARHRQLSANLGVQLEFEPRRRGDADFIFLAANVAAGRLIRPQLRFLYAGDLPTYATSAIYQAGSAGDPELDGVMFTDAPALLGTDQQSQELRSGIAKHWPAGNLARMRFHAMGFDAYTLIGTLPPGPVSPLAGLSGELSVDDTGRIHRRMPWAEFRDGRIVALPQAGIDPSPP
jgi:hypothetical protein